MGNINRILYLSVAIFFLCFIYNKLPPIVIAKVTTTDITLIIFSVLNLNIPTGLSQGILERMTKIYDPIFLYIIKTFT